MAIGIVIAAVACMNLITKLGRTLSLAGIVTTVAGTGWLLAIVLNSGTAATVAPAMIVIGIGMGATLSTLYDITIGDIDPAEAGSAGGSLSSVQQLANAIGPAVITTVYFNALTGGQAHAMDVSLIAVLAIGVLSRLVVPLLPRKPQPGAGH